MDETSRHAALESLRKSNFRRVLDAIDESKCFGAAASAKLLDVGCAHGWFLELARERGFDVTGIEPDPNVKQLGSIAPASIRRGFFPEVLSEDERFEVISFNDVLEHIPDIAAALDACKRHLAQDGLLVINAPDRTGVLYRISKVLCRLGFANAFNRMWQEGFPSPHVHYLDGNWFQQLARRHGLNIVRAMRLESITFDGLYNRILIDPSTSRAGAALLTASIAVALPALRVAPPDIRVWILARAT
ncbi:class I SAM-dependent methyltransferase [Lysobacter sp. HA35]